MRVDCYKEQCLRFAMNKEAETRKILALVSLL